ncbi:ATP-binding protein, partial [Chloroflexota bacterium]
SRGLTYLIVCSILVSALLLVIGATHQWQLFSIKQGPWVAAGLILLAALLFEPFRSQLQKVVDKVFYGGWYDYRAVIVDITQDLEQVRGLNELASLIGERMHRVLKLQVVSVLLCDSDDQFSVTATFPDDLEKDWSRQMPVQFSDETLAFLGKSGIIDRRALHSLPSEEILAEKEEAFFFTEGIHYWIPVLNQGKALGLLALGAKYDGSVFGGDDFEILTLIARQIGTVVENLHLLARLHKYAVELETRVDERTRELHEAIERVEAVIASVGDGVVVTDLDGNILSVNQAFELTSGFSSQKLDGTSYYDLIDVQENPNIVEEMHASLEAGQIWSGELKALAFGEKDYDIHLTMSPMRDQFRNIMGYVGSQRDITRQKEIERLKDHFIADVSHELRTPITNICLYLDLLADAPPRSQEHFVNVLKEQANLLRIMVDDILNLNRFALEKEAKFTYVDFGLIAEQVVASHKPLAERSGVAMTIEQRGSAPLMWGDFEQLARLVSNLVSNAIRYTPDGQVAVTISNDDHQICLNISDTGIGIDPVDMPHIFERFYRGKRVRQSKVSGTGLGLAIVKGIVELHNGSIKVESDIGKGSQFYIYLPIRKGDDDEPDHFNS